MARSFNAVQLLPTEDLFAELIRRSRVDAQLLERLCSYSQVTRIWFILWRSGAQSFRELERSGISHSTLSRCLEVLVRDGLVDQVGEKYRALASSWLDNKVEG